MTYIQVQEPKIFLNDFIDKIKTAKSRIWIQVLLFENGENIKRLVDELINVKNRNPKVDIKIHLDGVYRIFVHGKWYIIPPLNKQKRKYLNKIKDQTNELIHTLENNNIEVIINKNFFGNLVPMYRINHIKIFLIDETYSWIGGINLTDAAFNKHLDALVRFDNKEITRLLISNFGINKSDRQNDGKINKVDKENTIIIDNGVFTKSIIYEKFLGIVDNAKKDIFFVSQYLPDLFTLNKFINKAKKGVRVRILTSNRNEEPYNRFYYKIFYFIFKRRIRNIENIFLIHYKTKVHAKFLSVDNNTVLFGSHNMIRLTSLLSSEEIALLSSNKKLIADLNLYFESKIRPL